jgi:hypothetical protein
MKFSEDWGQSVPHSAFAQGDTLPVVYHFQPTKYVRVADDKLAEWEQYFINEVGLEPDRGKAAEFMKENRSATISGSYDCWDDCDYV